MKTDSRRFPRQTLLDLPDFSAIQSVVEWPNHEITRVSDLSYKGFSAEKSGLFSLSVNSEFTLHLRLGAKPAVTLDARLAWFDSQRAGFDILRLDGAGRRVLSFFADALEIGSMMKENKGELVGARPEEIWLSAGTGKNVSVVLDSSRCAILQVTVDLDGDQMSLNRDSELKTLTDLQLRALLVLSQMDKPGLPMKDFLRVLQPKESK